MSNSGSNMRQVSISRSTIAVAGCILMTIILLSGYVLTDYLQLKKTFINSNTLERKIADQDEEIKTQRHQIQAFATEINSLKDQIVQLNEFEKKIRIIANIEKSPEDEGLFGIGGSIPEDINANIRVTNKHDSLLRYLMKQR